MVHGPHTIQFIYEDADLGPLALGGIDSVDTALVERAWRRLGTAASAGRWHARLFDEHRTLLEVRPVEPVVVDRLLGGVAHRLAQARDAAAVLV